MEPMNDTTVGAILFFGTLLSVLVVVPLIEKYMKNRKSSNSVHEVKDGK